MAILAIDTSMAACSAAVMKSGETGSAQRFEPMPRGHAEALFPMIEAVMAEAGCGFPDLTRIAVTAGPGSFTGVRAGLAAARGFALALNAPIVSATSLEVMAAACVAELPPRELEGGFAVAHDARRGEFYVQLFSADGAPLGPPEALHLDMALQTLPPSARTVAGSGAQAIAGFASAQGRSLRAVLPELLPQAVYLARIAAIRTPSDHPPTPLYLRPPDAKPQTGKSIARAQD